MGSGSWRRRAESLEADSIVSPVGLHLVAWVLLFLVFVWGSLCCLLLVLLQYPGFLQSLHLSLQQEKRFADRPCLKLDRLPWKKKGGCYLCLLFFLFVCLLCTRALSSSSDLWFLSTVPSHSIHSTASFKSFLQ